MKILFIYTDIHSSVGYSAGIGILSAQLKKNGHATKLIHVSEELDYPLDLARINRDIADYRPGLICLSATTNQWHFVRAVGRSIKEHVDTAIMVGGHHPTADPESVIAEPWVDNTRTFANGAVRVAQIDAGEPAAGPVHLLVLSPDTEDEPWRHCAVVSFQDTFGFYDMDFAALAARYDPAIGLSFGIPVEIWLGDGNILARDLSVTLNQATAKVTAELSPR